MLLNQYENHLTLIRLAQIAAIAALDDQEYVDDCRLKNREGLKQYERVL